MSQPSEPIALVQSFVDHVTWIREQDQIINGLFQNPAAQAIMDRTSPQFMMSMNRGVLNSMIGAMYRITGPARSSHGQQNLTVRTIVKLIPWTEDRDSQAKRIAQRCDCFHQQLKEGWDNLLARNDLDTALSNQGNPFPLPPNIGKDVIEQLELLIKLASEQCGLPSSPVVLRCDDREITKALKDSLLFKRALKDPRLPKELRAYMQSWRLDDTERL